ncbi:DASH complex subunit ask1 [Mortierella antarctica]|nr:DASH complex subunit ask1 [Mortierella antarctica]
MSMTPQTASEVLDEIERLEQGITRTLQEIDQKFSTCQTIVTSKILPSIDLYGEASRDVWNHARLWLNFFKAASTSTAESGVAIRRAAASSSRASKLASAQPVDSQDDMEAVTSTTNGRRVQEHRHDDKYNRRESVALFASGMLDIEGSPLGSMPSTPTPRTRDRNQRPDLSAPTRIQWPETQPSTTPVRPRYQHTTEGIDQGSTTPRVTARDRPMTFSPYTSSQAPSSSIAPSTSGATKATSGATLTSSPRHQNLRANRKGSFLELDVDQDYQDVVTPPSTLQFSIPESRLATTPRSVIAKSRVDRILMKDGLVIPQPIFVRDDEEALESRHRRNSSSEQNIGSSRKRNLDGDLLSSDQSQFQSKERLLASPRKMASVQDFLGISHIGSANSSHSQLAESSQGVNGEEVEEEDESDRDGRQSPSRRLMAQIQSQTEQEEGPQSQDPLMALVTPPDLRTSVLDYGTRTSIPYRQVTVASSLASSKAIVRPLTHSGSSASTQRNGPVLTTTPLDVFPPATSSTSISAPSVPAPIEPSSSANIRSTVDAIFKESFNSGFAATSGATLQPSSSINVNNGGRRQTMAAPVPVSYTTLPLTNSRNIRNSIGPGLLRSSVRSAAPDASDRPSTTVPRNSRLSLLGSSAFRQTLYPATGSTLQTTGANSTVASITPSTTTSQAALPKTTTPGSIPPSPALGRGLTRPQGHSMGSVGRPSLGRLSLGAFGRTGVPVTTPPNREHTHDSHLDTHLAPASASSSTFYSDEHHTQFRTPTDRHPPPAPRLGYHSDTLMTQSSLGLNHDGFASGGAGFDDFDRTRTTLASMGGSSGTRTRDMDLTVGVSNAAAIVAAAATNGFQPANPSHRSSGVTTTVSLSKMLTTQMEGDDVEDEDDEDETGDMSRSPCPPGRTFRANTDLRSVAQAASSTSLGSESVSGLFRPSAGRKF